MKPLFGILLFAVALAAQTAPGQQPFTLELAASSTTVKSGSPVLVTVTVTNNSSQDLDLSGSISDLTGIDSNFIFEVRGSDQALVGKRQHKHPELAGGHAILGRVLGPGKTLTEEQDVGRLYDITKPGKYVVEVSRPTTSSENGPRVKSNKLLITVTP